MNTQLNITVLAKKGGVGKTTLSLMLYEALRQAGKTVYVQDWDAQGTSTKALAVIIGEQTITRQDADIVIWDTPPSLDHTATATAARSANLALAITTPAPVDIWEAEEAAQFVRDKNSQAAVRIVVNKFEKGTILGRIIQDSLKQVTAPCLPVMISERQCYKHAPAQGWKALDASAREEVLQFAVAVLSQT
jgi:cellulose biosynthesis protein BcsQ